MYECAPHNYNDVQLFLYQQYIVTVLAIRSNSIEILIKSNIGDTDMQYPNISAQYYLYRSTVFEYRNFPSKWVL
jgi:hypothetical protein